MPVTTVGVVHAPAAHRVGDGPVRATVTVASMGVASTAMALVVLEGGLLVVLFRPRNNIHT